MKIIGNQHGRRIEKKPELIIELNKETGGKKQEAGKGATESPDFSLENLTDFYSISGIPYRNEICCIDLSKTLLPSKTQDEHAEHRLNAKSGEFCLGDMSLYHALFTALYNNRDSQSFKDQIEEARQFIKESMLEHWLMTLTRIKYNPDGNDLVIHNYHQKDEWEVRINTFVGPDEHLNDVKTTNVERPLQVLLDTQQDGIEIISAYIWLTGGNAYIWRVNSRPEETDERVARLDADFSRASFDCIGDPSNANEGLGARKISPSEHRAANSRADTGSYQ